MEHTKRQPRKLGWRFVLLAAVLAVLISGLVRSLWLDVYYIPSASMEPMFREGERILVSSTDFRAELAAFKVPTLIIHGTEDKTVSIDASARIAAKGIAGSRLIEYEGAAHGVTATHKDRLIKDLLAFLA